MRSCARELRLCFAVNATLELVARVTTAVALTAYAWDNLRSDVCCWSPFLGFSGDGNFVKFPSDHGSSSRFPFYVDAQNWKRRLITTEVGPYRWHTHALNVLDCV